MPPSKNPKAKAKRPWQGIAKEAQDHRDASLDRVPSGFPGALEKYISSKGLPQNSMSVPSKILSLTELEITEMAPEELLEALATRRLRATEVTTAFLRRAVIAQKLASCSDPDIFLVYLQLENTY